MIGSAFDDRFVSGSAANGFTGGNGIDTVDYSQSSAAVTVNLGTGKGSAGDATGDTYSGIENAVGTKFADVLTGNAAANVLDGGDGDDSLEGGEGDDTLIGGQGDDRLYGGAGADALNGGAGTDTADYRTALAGVVASLATGGTGGDAAGDKFGGIENLSGGNFDDILTGNSGDNRIVGRQGSDQLFGGDGDDMLAGGGGYDHQDGGNGIDTMDYSASWGRVVVDLSTGKGSGAEAASDTYASIENVLGSDFDDRLVGDSSANRLTGGEGLDTLMGGDGNDILVGGAGADVLNGGTGERDAADYQSASTGVTLNLATGGTGGEAAGDTFSSIEFVYGSSSADVITGDDAINRLVGNAGDDSLDGGKGNDYLLGGLGTDTMTGGAGDDVFVFDGAFGNDTITDFAAGAGRTDRVWLTGTGLADFADVLAHAADVSGNAVITIGGFGSITFTGVSVASLQADDFISVADLAISWARAASASR